MSRKSPVRKLMPGPARDQVAADLKLQYDKGVSIRSLAESTGRSYGGVHRLLCDAGVVFRSRGGALRKPSGS